MVNMTLRQAIRLRSRWSARYCFQGWWSGRSAKNADGKHGNGDGSGNREAGAQADIDGNRAEEQTEERAKNDRPNSEFFWGFFGRNVGAEFTRGAVELHARSRPPVCSLKESSPVAASHANVAYAGGLCRRWAGGERESSVEKGEMSIWDY